MTVQSTTTFQEPEALAPMSPPPSSPVPSGRHSPSRKDTILSLVEMLLQESGAAARAKTIPPSFEDDRDVPSVDEYIQEAGAQSFHKFQRSVNALDKELRNFANASRQLGSSVAILSSGFRLRERLAQLLYLYRQNAAALFPRKVAQVNRDGAMFGVRPSGPTEKRRRGKAHLNVPRPVVSENLGAETLPDNLEAFAKDLKTFLNCLNEFPEFTDEAVNAAILSFEGDLSYWSSCLREYAGQFKTPAVQRYIHELSQEMGDHINGITSSLCMFIEVGVPTIRFAQKHGSSNLLNLSTIATFFSAVTATTMQFSYEFGPETPGGSIVNCFWFSSLVFSIAAAVNSLLGLTWKQAMYRSPGHRVPWWVLIWIKRSPLVFLVLSVACFSIGLCAFSYASGQSHITSTFTTVLTAFTSFGLAAVSTWFASERWAFSRHRGQKWLSDVLHETTGEFIRHPGISWIYTACKFLGRHLVRLQGLYTHVASCMSDLWCCLRSHDDTSIDVEANSATIASHPNSSLSTEPKGHVSTVHLPAMPTPRLPNSPVPAPTPVNSPSSPTATFTANSGPLSVAAVEGEAAPPRPGQLLWKSAFQKVKMASTVNATPSSLFINRATPQRKGTDSSSIFGAPSIATTVNERRRTVAPETMSNVRSRLSALVPRLKELETTQDLPAHSGLVRHMQFSPDGRFLATSSWDTTSIIYKVGDPFISHRLLGHTQGFVGQVAWSPTGNILLTKLPKGIKVWTAEDGVCKKTINRESAVESLTWMPDGQSFLSVEDSTVTKLSLSGVEMDKYDFGRIKLHDVAVTPDSLRLVGVGPLLESPTGLQPSKSRVEKRLVVYNIGTNSIESQTPLLNEVRDITIAQGKSGVIALVSYEKKAPPQLWKIELAKETRNNVETIEARLTLRHTFMPKAPIEFAGESYFGGKNNELVLCAGKAGEILIWDQESGALLHLIRAKVHGGELTSVAWNHAAEDPYMFATGSHDGGVRVWTRFDDSSEADNAGQPAEYHRDRHYHQADAKLYRYGAGGSTWDMVRSPSPEEDEEDEEGTWRRGLWGNQAGTSGKDRRGGGRGKGGESGDKNRGVVRGAEGRRILGDDDDDDMEIPTGTAKKPQRLSWSSSNSSRI